jgi:hypothetical protein
MWSVLNAVKGTQPETISYVIIAVLRLLLRTSLQPENDSPFDRLRFASFNFALHKSFASLQTNLWKSWFTKIAIALVDSVFLETEISFLIISFIFEP